MKRCTHKATSLSRSVCAETAASPWGKQITTSQFRKMADSQHDGRSEIKNMSNSVFEHMTVQAYHEMRQERGLVLEKEKLPGRLHTRVQRLGQKAERTY